MSTLEVPWPSTPLTPKQWADRVEALATEAEALVGRPCPPQTAARLAVWWVGLCWSGITASTIAASCRASLLLGENVVLATGVADQLAEVIHTRLDGLWEQAQDAAVVESEAVLMLESPPSAEPRPRGRKPRQPEPVPEPADLSHLPEAELMVLEPEGFHAPVGLEPEPVAVVEEEPEPEPIPAAPAEAPLFWLTTDEVAELLEVSRATVSNWRALGRFGADGCRKRGRGLAFDPAAVEQLMQVADEPTDAAAEPCSADSIPDGLDKLLNEVQARC